MTLALYLVPLVAVAAIAAALHFQRAPRRAMLATLRVATQGQKPPPVPRDHPGARPEREQRTAEDRGSPLPRLLGPAVAALASTARHLTPPTYAASAQRRLTLAGKDRPVDVDRFLALRILSLALVAPTFLVLLVMRVSGIYGLLFFLLAISLLGLGPEALLNRNVSRRQETIRHDLPVMLELLMISVEAGLGFDQALARAVSSVPGPLSEEFSRFLGEVRMGADHREALEAIDRRTDIDELRSFLMALVQAEAFGVSVGSILRAQAEQARTAQRQHVQELAQKAPVKMLFPLVFCVLPALFIVVIGPAGIEIYHTLVK